MRSIPLTRSTKVRCAPFHLDTGADPVGSTGAYDAFMCVEVPLPWEQDISMHEPFAALAAGTSIEGADGRIWRPQGLVPRGDTGELTRVIAMEQPAGGPAGPYRRREWWVAPERVEPLCRALLAADDGAGAEFDEERVTVDDDVVDLFVCTHGRRDVCCGGSGTELHDQLAALLAGDDSVRLWRVSHTGGHRFAPTALTFPDGYAWAHLDTATALAVARRTGSVDAVRANCRGASSVGGAAGQVADRELLARAGWSWLGATRRLAVAEPGGPTRRSEVRVDATLPDGTQVAAMVQVELEREIPQPTCGEPQDTPAPMSPVWRTVRVDPIPAQ